MQQPSLGLQNVKILYFELFNQIFPQQKYVKNLYFQLFNQICLQPGYATAEPWSLKCQNSKFGVM